MTLGRQADTAAVRINAIAAESLFLEPEAPKPEP